MRPCPPLTGLIAAACVAATAAAEAPPGVEAVPIGQAVEAARAGVGAAERAPGLAAAGKPAEAAGALRSLASDPALNDAARERLLRETLLALAERDPDPALRAEVAALAGWQARTWVWTDEHGHRQEFPLYDVAAAAAFTRRRWEEAAAEKAALPALRAGDAAALAERYLAGDAPARRGIEQAARAAASADLLALGDELAARLARGEAVGGLARAAGERTGDARLLQAVLLQADGPTALATLRGLDPATPGYDALELLEAASTRDDIASAALYRIGALAAGSPRARDFLFARLGAPGGETAAHALAETGDGGVPDRLAGILADDGATEARRRHALLALRLVPGGRAEAHLATFAARPDAPPALVEEVPSWLRD